ncbi:MAG TPA: hypothetical protein VE196_07335 [Pseudonocardiaceae bacterium]|nr:hypothetical protein [Pseudonocardiaceae bacterium]
MSAEDSLWLPGRAPDPARAAGLARAHLVAAVRGARPRRGQGGRAAHRCRGPGVQSSTLEGVYGVIVVGQVGIVTALNEQITRLQAAAAFTRCPARSRVRRCM